jgi:hypothetical protein
MVCTALYILCIVKFFMLLFSNELNGVGELLVPALMLAATGFYILCLAYCTTLFQRGK